jgi:hypothetical protein
VSLMLVDRFSLKYVRSPLIILFLFGDTIFLCHPCKHIISRTHMSLSFYGVQVLYGNRASYIFTNLKLNIKKNVQCHCYKLMYEYCYF